MQITADRTIAPRTASRQRSQIEIIGRELFRNRGAVAGAILLIAMISISVAAPLVAPYDPLIQSLTIGPEPPGPGHLFGTDNFGRDVFSRVVHGGRISLTVGLISVGIACAVGVPLGLLAGYRRGWLEALIMRSMDILLAFPGILLALMVVAILGAGLNSVMVAVGVAYVPTYVRLVRGLVLKEREQMYVEAARVVGCNDRTVMLRHLLPSVVPSLIVVATLGVAGGILTAASLSFIGMGARPPSPEWGAMLGSGRDYLRRAWWIATFPGFAILVSTLGINLFGDGLRDALDPRLRRR